MRGCQAAPDHARRAKHRVLNETLRRCEEVAELPPVAIKAACEEELKFVVLKGQNVKPIPEGSGKAWP